MKYLYKLPQREFPYEQLIAENAKRGRLEREYNIIDTDAFKDDRYFDILALHSLAQVMGVPFLDSWPVLGASSDDKRSVLSDIT